VIKFVGDLQKVGSFSGHTLLDTAKYRMSAEELANNMNLEGDALTICL
jgi:hypothetical protein